VCALLKEAVTPKTHESAWGIGGIILTKEIEVLGERAVPVPLFPPQISHGFASD
jgi:hypothetical protein